jgi:hypothetical protein
MQLRRRSVLAALAAGVAGAAGRPAVAQQADPPRPRVLGSGGDFERIANVVDADEYEPNVSAWYGNVESRARDLLETDTVEYELPDGVRLLPISREVLSRVRTLGLVYRVSGDMVYASRAWRELEAAAAFDTWHPEHFLDVAEMTAAFGIAYDWLHDYLDASQRETVRTAMVEKGIDLGIAAHEGRGGVPSWWTDDEFNWNSVCNGGLSVGACALVGEDGVDQRKLETLLSYTSEGILHAFENFGEDGGWPEGYNYWGYNTRYQAYYLTSTLNTLSGADLDVEAGIPDVDGFPVAGNFPMAMTGIRGVFNYADAGSSPKSNSVLFWLARQFDEPAWAAFHLRQVGERGDVIDLLWYDPDSVGSIDSKPRDMYFGGVEVASVRTDWGEQEGLYGGYVGFKGGNNQYNHGDLDLGSFVYDADGTRWATDLGAENYNVPDYWDMSGGRWHYYRKRAEGHNTLVIDPDGSPDQSPYATAAITAFASGDHGAYGIVDLTGAYPVADSVRRGFAFDRGTKSLVVQDELSLSEAVPVWWFMHSEASMVVRGDPLTATLSGLNALRARILGPDDAGFEVMGAAPLPSSPNPDVQNRNAGVEKLAVELKDVTDLRLTVQLVPLPDFSEPPDPPEVRPLDEWTVEYADFGPPGSNTTPTPETTTTTTTETTTTTSTGGPGFGTLGALGGAGLAAWRLARGNGNDDGEA